MIIELLKNRRGKYYHRLKGDNRKIIYHSEAYSSKQGALKTIKAVITRPVDKFIDLT